jgi:hypothetical protein
MWPSTKRILTASLVGVVSMLMVDGAAAAGDDFSGDVFSRIAGTETTLVVSVAKFIEAGRSEAVIISDLAPNIEEMSVVREITEILRRDWLWFPLSHCCPRRDHIRLADKCFFGRHVEVLLLNIVGHFEIDKPTNISRGEITDVVEADMYISVAPIFERLYSKRLGANVGALDNLRMLCLSFSSIFRDSPQFISGPPKAASENGKNDCKGCGDEPFIFVSNVRKPFDSDQDGSVEGGAVFFGLLGICGVAGGIAYWMASHQR